MSVGSSYSPVWSMMSMNGTVDISPTYSVGSSSTWMRAMVRSPKSLVCGPALLTVVVYPLSTYVSVSGIGRGAGSLWTQETRGTGGSPAGFRDGCYAIPCHGITMRRDNAAT